MKTVFLSLQQQISACERVKNLLSAYPVLAQADGHVAIIMGSAYVTFRDLGYEVATGLFGAAGWVQTKGDGETFIDMHSIDFGVNVSFLVCERETTGGGVMAPGAPSPAFPQNETTQTTTA